MQPIGYEIQVLGRKMVKITPTNADIPSLLADLWAPLSEEQRRLLSEHITVQSYKKNEHIYIEGETPTHMMCLLAGKVKIYKEGVGGRNQIIRLYKPVEYFGYHAYFSHKDYICTATTVEAAVICQIPLRILDSLVKQNNQLAYFIIERLSHGLDVADQRTVNLTQKHIRGRLAESLLLLRDSYGVEEDGFTLSIYLSREDLANLSNMTTSNAIRTLSQFASEHLIAIDGRKIKLIDEEKLKKISRIG